MEAQNAHRHSEGDSYRPLRQIAPPLRSVFLRSATRFRMENSVREAGTFPYLTKIAGFSPEDMDIHVLGSFFLQGIRDDMASAVKIAHGIQSEAVSHFFGNAAGIFGGILQNPSLASKFPQLVKRIPKFARAVRVIAL